MTVLGIAFTNDNHNITQVNMEPKLLKIENEIAQWRRRHLTTMGRITVVKSLLISKLVHLFTALPNPSQLQMKRIESMLFSFIWGRKRDPIKRAKVIQDYAIGGLRMVDVRAFINSMKLTWLKRLLTSNAAWTYIAADKMPLVQNLLSYGSKKLQRVKLSTNNPFWRDVIDAFSHFSQNFNMNVQQILSESLWFSDHTKFECSIIREWDRKGLRFIADLIDENTGQLHTKETLQDSFNIKMTFLCYRSLIRSLPNDVRVISETKLPGPVIPSRINIIMNHTNFPRLAYSIYLQARENEIAAAKKRQKEKWIRDIGCSNSNSFGKIAKASNSTTIKMFHYKLVNRIISTNRYLKIIGIRSDDSCTFCKREPETLSHMYWYCPKVQVYITSIKADIARQYRVFLNLSVETWFFSTNLSEIETVIIELAKIVIYESRYKETQPTVNHFRNKLKWEAKIECNAAMLANKQDMFKKKWGPFKQVLEQQVIR